MGVLEPVRRGEPVSYRPPGWEARGRPGSIVVPAGQDLVVVAGVGSGRGNWRTCSMRWCGAQSDATEAQRRGIARDVAEGSNGGPEEAPACRHEWTAQELDFLASQDPREQADVVV